MIIRDGTCIQELLSKLRDRVAPPSEFDAGFEQVIYTKSQSSQKALVQYILRKVALFEHQPAIGETDDLTIEHLLAQSNLKKGVGLQTIGQIGNLILVDLKTNGDLSNKSFKDKKQILIDRGYKLPSILLNASEIDGDLIEQNTKRISELARENIWKV